MRNLIFLATAGAALACAAAYAADPASGTLSDSSRTLTYTGGPYVVPNQSARATGESAPICEEGTPTCDVFELTVDLSDDVRGSASGEIDIIVGWELGEADFDVYLYNAAGELVYYRYTSANPEEMFLTFDEVPNGVYKVVVIPWLPLAQTFTATITVAGVEDKSGLGLVAGALPASLLLALGLGALRRRLG